MNCFTGEKLGLIEIFIFHFCFLFYILLKMLPLLAQEQE